MPTRKLKTNTGRQWDMARRLGENQPSLFGIQERLILAAGMDAEISDVLAPAGLSIDDLVYENSRSLEWKGDLPLSLSSFKREADGTPIVSFFTGCGGMDIGFEALASKTGRRSSSPKSSAKR